MVFTDPQEAKSAAEAAGKCLIAFGQRQGKGVAVAGYVIVDQEATPDEITHAVFEAKNGRPIDDRERLLMELAEARSAQG